MDPRENSVYFKGFETQHLVCLCCGVLPYQVRGGRHLGQLGDVELHIVLGQGHQFEGHIEPRLLQVPLT